MSGAIDRAKGVKSGRLEYQFSSGLAGGKAVPLNRTPTTTLLFSRNDWIERRSLGGTKRLSYRGSLVRIDEARQPDGSVHETATIMKSNDTSRQNRHPWFAGSFWFVQQRDYVDKYRAAFRLGAPNSVHGVPCEVCECNVTADDARSMLRVRSPLLNSGGVLRLCVAPQLGYVLPLIEMRSPQGDKVLSYESKDWVEFPNQFYFPRQTRMELRAPGGETVYEQFTITPQQINEPIPNSEFILKLASGTTVRDERDPANVRREELENDSTTAIAAGVDHADTTATMILQAMRNRWLLLTGALVITALLTLMFWRLFARKNAIPPRMS